MNFKEQEKLSFKPPKNLKEPPKNVFSSSWAC